MTQKRQVIAQFFKEIKKIKRGEVQPLKEAPLQAEKRATMPEKLGNPKVQEWLRRNRGR